MKNNLYFAATLFVVIFMFISKIEFISFDDLSVADITLKMCSSLVLVLTIMNLVIDLQKKIKEKRRNMDDKDH